MSLFMDVHNIEGGVSASDVAKAHQRDLETQGRYGVSYLRYWVDEEDGKIFCLVEAETAEDADAVHRAAHGLVADAIYPVVDDGDPLPSEAIQPRSSDSRRGMVASASLLAAAILFGTGFVVSEAVNGGEPPPEIVVVVEPEVVAGSSGGVAVLDRFERSPRNREPLGETLAAGSSGGVAVLDRFERSPRNREPLGETLAAGSSGGVPVLDRFERSPRNRELDG